MKLNAKILSYRHLNGDDFFFRNLDLSIEKNGLHFLIGSSGIGKTTLLNILLGVHNGYFKGEVNYSTSGPEQTPAKIREMGLIGYQSQDFSLIPWMNVKENILLPSLINKNIKAPTREDINSCLSKFNLDKDVLKKNSDELSFGMRIRIGLIRTVIYKPKFIILDELFTGIDSYTNDLISTFLKNNLKESIVFSVTHNVERAISIADSVYVLFMNNTNEREIKKFSNSNFETDINKIINYLKH